MALNTLARRMAERFKQELAREIPGRVLEVRVFGSAARGEAHVHSDLDVFVLVDVRDDALSDAVCRAADCVTDEFEGAMPISPRIMSREHFQELLDLERKLALDILREGIAL